MYRFIMNIGDWSGDGHGNCYAYTISSNKPVEEVREAHYKIKKATGIDIEAVDASLDYDPRNHAKILRKFKAVGFTPMLFDDGSWVPSCDEMARLWVFLLQKADPQLKLAIETPEDMPSLHFYGWDSKGRHIGCVGYEAAR